MLEFSAEEGRLVATKAITDHPAQHLMGRHSKYNEWGSDEAFHSVRRKLLLTPVSPCRGPLDCGAPRRHSGDLEAAFQQARTLRVR